MLSIAMCTYNGEKYIEAQLHSFCQQTLLPQELVVCDDGSTDNTIEKIKQFAKNAPFEVRLYENEKSLGPAQNFAYAASLCRGEYVALSDQDDVWLPGKLELEMSLMLANEKNDCPILVHSDLAVTDANLKITNKSMFKAQHLRNEPNEKALKTLLVQNYVTGCTILINRSLLDRALPMPQQAVMHDWWLALVAGLFGEIYCCAQATVLYRQHEKNTIGARKYFSLASISKVCGYSLLLDGIQRAERQVLCLSKHKLKLYTPQRSLIEKYLLARKKKNVWSLWQMGARKQGFWRNLLFYVILIFFRNKHKTDIL